MKIRDAVEKRCSKCNSHIKTITPEVFGCDECQKEIDLQDDKYGNRISPHLDITIFYANRESDGNTSYHTFCSWKCCFRFLLKLKTRTDIDFISLPYLSWERDIKDEYVGDFFKLLEVSQCQT